MRRGEIFKISLPLIISRMFSRHWSAQFQAEIIGEALSVSVGGGTARENMEEKNSMSGEIFKESG